MPSEFDMPKKEIVKRVTAEERLARAGDPLGLTPRQANAITQARLQYALSALAEDLADEVKAWIREVGARSPAEATRLYLELLEFRMPRLKAAQVVANFTPDASKRQLKDMSIDELNTIISEQ